MRKISCRLCAAIVAPLSMLPSVALAHTGTEAVYEVVDDVATGARATSQSTIDIKRSSTNTVDGLSSTDIGDLPALPIGEALESITGAASQTMS